MKELRDLKDLTIHDVQPISDESTRGLQSRFEGLRMCTFEGLQMSRFDGLSASIPGAF